MDTAKRAQTQNAGEVSSLQRFFSQSVELMTGKAWPDLLLAKYFYNWDFTFMLGSTRSPPPFPYSPPQPGCKIVHGPKSSWHGKSLLLLAWVKPCSILQFFNSSGKFQLENPFTDRNFPLMTLPEAGVFHCEWGFVIIFFPPTGSFRLFTLPQTVFFQLTWLNIAVYKSTLQIILLFVYTTQIWGYNKYM